MKTSFVGRADELAAFASAVAVWRSGRQAIVEVVGPMGIGKTALMREAVDRYADGARTLRGRAVDVEKAHPFHPFTQALYGDGHTDANLSRGWDGVVSGAQSTPGDDPSAPDSAQIGRYRRARDLLWDVASQAGPVMVILDDLHWADPSTRGLLGYLARYPVAAPLLLALAYRPDAMPEDWQRLSKLGRPPTVHHLPLGPLDHDAAQQLAGVGVDDGPPCYEEASGNPRLLLAFAPVGTPGRAEAQRELVDEWTHLPPPDRTLASAGAVIGAAFDMELLAAAADLPLAAAEQGTDRLVRHGLFRAAGALFRLAHPRLPELLSERITAAWRPAAHRRILAHLNGRPGPARTLAPHVERALALPGRGASDDDVAVLRRAAAEVSGTDPLTAARWLRAALDALDSRVDDRTLRHDVCWELVGVLGAAGRLAEARALLHEVLSSLPPDLGSRRADVVALCGRMEWLLGHYTEAGALLRQGLATAAGTVAVDGVALAVQYGAVSLLAGEPAAASAALEAAAELAEERANRATVLAVRGFTEIHEGDVAAARTSVADCAPLVDALSDADLVDRTEALAALGLTEVFLERFADAHRHVRRGEVLARRTGRHAALPYLLFGRCEVAYWTGRLADAVTLARQAQRAATAIDSPDLCAFGLAFESKSVAWLGRPEAVRAVELARQAVDMAGQDAAGYARRSASMALASALLLVGDAAGCGRAVLDIGHGPDLPNLQTNLRPTWYWLLCLAALGAGAVDAAREWAQRAQAQAADLALSGQVAFADLAWAAVLRADGDSAGALGRARSASFGFARAGMLLPRGVALAGAAAAAADLGDERVAGSLRADAWDIGTRCGSGWIADLVDASAADPFGARRDATSDPDGATGPLTSHPALRSLTLRERQIAELTATGATAHAIGRALAISSRTVEAHLSRIYRKLDLRSRGALVALVAGGAPR